MRIAILLGSADISGGTYVIFEHALRMMRRGQNITMITEQPVSMSTLEWHPEARSLGWMTYSELGKQSFDIAIATWWRTVYELYRVPANHYVYFVQSIETRFYPEEEKPLRKLVEGTYTLPLHIITEATWIQEYLLEHHHHFSSLVLNGIRKDIYCEAGPAHANRESGRLRVLVEGPLQVPFKNVERTIELCKQSAADEIWLLTSTPISSYPGVNQVYSQVPIHQTPLIYRSCDVIVKLSYVEGMFGPPLEMFHCGGTAITYNVTGHDLYIEHGVNALVAHCDDEQQVIDFLNNLKTNPVELDNLKSGARLTAGKWPDWEQSSTEFEGVLHTIASQHPVMGQTELTKRTAYLFDFYVVAEQNRQQMPVRQFQEKVKQTLRSNCPVLYERLRRLKWALKR